MTDEVTKPDKQHKNIAAALAAAQMKMGKAIKSASNPHFKSRYADLASVMDACLPALNEAGIAVIQPMVETELGRAVKTVFLHDSGERLECSIPLILGKQDMQGLGSAITYARRYGLMALAGIAPEDDDGNAAVASVHAQGPNGKTLSWSETVLADLPPEATKKDKARALTDAITANFQRKKTPGELENEWNRRQTTIDHIGNTFAEMGAEIFEAYEVRMRAIAPQEAAE